MLGDEATDADLAEMVEEGADLVGGAVDVVGVLVEEGEEHLFASLPVAGLAGPWPMIVDGTDNEVAAAGYPGGIADTWQDWIPWAGGAYDSDNTGALMGGADAAGFAGYRDDPEVAEEDPSLPAAAEAAQEVAGHLVETFDDLGGFDEAPDTSSLYVGSSSLTICEGLQYE